MSCFLNEFVSVAKILTKENNEDFKDVVESYYTCAKKIVDKYPTIIKNGDTSFMKNVLSLKKNKRNDLLKDILNKNQESLTFTSVKSLTVCIDIKEVLKIQREKYGNVKPKELKVRKKIKKYKKDTSVSFFICIIRTIDI